MTYYNLLALAVLVALVVSVKYAVFWSDELNIVNEPTTEVLPFQFYDTLKTTTVSTTVTRRATGEREWLQAGAFAQQQNALRRANLIESMGIDTAVETVEKDSGTHYIVYIGPFDSRRLVQQTKQSLMRGGIVTNSVWR